MMKQRILVVGDDMSLRATLARWLIAAGYSVELAASAKHAREVLANERIGLAIMAPERLDGGDLAREIRTAVDRLILVTDPADTSSASIRQAAQADGYLAKPLREDDVLARINAALRTEANAAESTCEQLRFAGYTLDAVGRSCFDPSGRAVALTKAELSLLLTLARRRGQVVSRDELTHAVAGRPAEHGDRSVDVLTSRLRRKIEADPKSPRLILTVAGVGYKLATEAMAASVSVSPPPRPPIDAKAQTRIAGLAAILLRRLRPRVSSPLSAFARHTAAADNIISKIAKP